jgi:hypothetical protein
LVTLGVDLGVTLGVTLGADLGVALRVRDMLCGTLCRVRVVVDGLIEREELRIVGLERGVTEGAWRWTVCGLVRWIERGVDRCTVAGGAVRRIVEGAERCTGAERWTGAARGADRCTDCGAERGTLRGAERWTWAVASADHAAAITNRTGVTMRFMGGPSDGRALAQASAVPPDHATGPAVAGARCTRGRDRCPRRGTPQAAAAGFSIQP